MLERPLSHYWTSPLSLPNSFLTLKDVLLQEVKCTIDNIDLDNINKLMQRWGTVSYEIDKLYWSINELSVLSRSVLGSLFTEILQSKTNLFVSDIYM